MPEDSQDKITQEENEDVKENCTSKHEPVTNHSVENYKGLDFSPVVEKVLPAVVNVATTQILGGHHSSGGGNSPPPHCGFEGGSIIDEIMRDYKQSEKPSRKIQSLGSGFVISNDGKNLRIVTNNHVIAGAKSIKIFLYNKTELDAKVFAADDRSDIAILECSITKLSKEKRNAIKALKWANSDKIAPGNSVLAFGNPFNLGSSVTMGIISFIGRYILGGTQQRKSFDVQYIQHCAQINLGNSGGCLTDINGEVIGINTAIFSPSGGSVGIGFAIPANYAKRVIDQLQQHGYIKRGSLGIHIQSFTSELKSSLKSNVSFDDVYGPIISSITPNGPSDGILKIGDIIIEFDGKKIDDDNELPSLVAAAEIGRKTITKVLRKTEENHYEIVELQIVIGELLNEGANEGESKAIEIKSLGLTVGPIADKTDEDQDEKKGVIIQDIAPNSPAHEAGLAVGDQINEVDGQDIVGEKDMSAPQKFASIIDKAVENGKRERIMIYLNRKGLPPIFFSVRIKPEHTVEEDKAPAKKKK